MSKDFDTWNIRKKTLNAAHSRPMFKEREIWWCELGANVGDEEDGKGEKFSRPVLVLKKFNRHIFLAIPLSTQLKESHFYYRLHFKGRDQSLLLSQLKLIDAKRLKDKMGELPSHEIIILKEKLRELIL